MDLLMLWFQEEARGLFPAPGEIGIEQTVFNSVQWLKLAVELTGAVIIGAGILAVMSRLLRSLFNRQLEGYNEIRLTLSRFLALALEFQLGADILSTAIAPSWDQIGKLGAIALIRTTLNYFLSKEMREEREGISADTPPTGNVKRDADRESADGQATANNRPIR